MHGNLPAKLYVYEDDVGAGSERFALNSGLGYCK
jgi:hypothetical protein